MSLPQKLQNPLSGLSKGGFRRKGPSQKGPISRDAGDSEIVETLKDFRDSREPRITEKKARRRSRPSSRESRDLRATTDLFIEKSPFTVTPLAQTLDLEVPSYPRSFLTGLRTVSVFFMYVILADAREDTKWRFRKRVVLANVLSFRFFVPMEHANVTSLRFSFRGNARMYTRSGFRSGGTSAKTPLFQNHPFSNSSPGSQG